MKVVLFLGLVGAALYMALVVSHDRLSGDRTEDNLTRQALSSPPARQLRSWGTDLPALARRAPASRRRPVAAAGQYDGNRDQGSGYTAGSEETLTSSQSTATAYDPTEWVRVGLAARVHREASVSSPTMRFYQPGTALQVVRRENGWVQINDPTSREGGWVLEQYLVSSDVPTVTQTAAATPTALSEPTQAKPTPRAKKRARVSRPTVRAPHDVAIAQFDTGSERRAERRRGFGLFFFRRYARTQPAAPHASRAWLVGSE
jgi:hypothetical protein